jgi:hypothetical protein
MSNAIKTLAIATILAASASAAFAQSPPYGYPGERILPAFPIAPYGYANRSYSSYSYSSYYATYPARRRARLFSIEWPSQRYPCSTILQFCDEFSGSN